MWKRFWNDLNIRKFLALIFSLSYCISVFIMLWYGIESKNKEVLMWGVSGIGSVLGVCMGYYFGFTNGQVTPLDKNDNR